MFTETKAKGTRTGRTTSYRVFADMSAHATYAHGGNVFATADSYAGRICQDVHMYDDAAVHVRTYPDGAGDGPFAAVTVESDHGNTTVYVKRQSRDTVLALLAALSEALEHVNR